MTQASTQRFVICVGNEDYPASLEKRKIYVALPDADAESHHQLQVIDESGEDYLYPESYFVPIQLPKASEKLLAF